MDLNSVPLAVGLLLTLFQQPVTRCLEHSCEILKIITRFDNSFRGLIIVKLKIPDLWRVLQCSWKVCFWLFHKIFDQ